MPLPAAAGLSLSDSQRKELKAISGHRNTPRGIVLRVNVVLGAAEGFANRVLARKLSTSVPTVLLWRKRYESEGLKGILEDRPRSGRPKRISEEQETAIVEATIKTTPKDATQWSVRVMAAAQKVSSATVQRIWKKHKLQPHRVESFKFSNDPQFAWKVRDIVGLYMNPPDKAIVLSVDEKSQIQALDRTQPILPLRPGLPERQTHDYERHGTTNLFAALNVLEGTVIGECLPRHRHQEFLRFLHRIDRSVESDLEIHLILDNYGRSPACTGSYPTRICLTACINSGTYPTRTRMSWRWLYRMSRTRQLKGNGTEAPFLLALQAALQQAQSPIGNAGLLPGTFVPTAEIGGEIPNQIIIAPEWGGLSCTLSSLDEEGSGIDNGHQKPKQKVQNSVRDLVIANGVLYVADEAGNAVRVYDPATRVPWGSPEIPSPMAVENGNIYVGSQGSVFLRAFGRGAAEPSGKSTALPGSPSSYTNSVDLTLEDRNLTAPKDSAVSGMTFDDSGNLYVALHNKKAIYQFQPNPNGGSPPVVSGSNPFILV